MAHPEVKTFCINIPSDENSLEKFQDVMDVWVEAEVEYEEKVMKDLGISHKAASAICYLRTRSRWTQEKEDYLVKLDKEGKELPNVLAGDF
jgi:hypothetical protein